MNNPSEKNGSLQQIIYKNEKKNGKPVVQKLNEKWTEGEKKRLKKNENTEFERVLFRKVKENEIEMRTESGVKTKNEKNRVGTVRISYRTQQYPNPHPRRGT